MAGHSKWANTRHRKAAQDAKRGKIFTKIIRELVTAAKLGGGDPDANPRLRAAVDKALANNMTRDTLNRAMLAVWVVMKTRTWKPSSMKVMVLAARPL